MTEDQIKKRMEELMTQGRQLETQIHMINGALEQCKWQLAEMEKQESPEKTAE